MIFSCVWRCCDARREAARLDSTAVRSCGGLVLSSLCDYLERPNMGESYGFVEGLSALSSY